MTTTRDTTWRRRAATLSVAVSAAVLAVSVPSVDAGASSVAQAGAGADASTSGTGAAVMNPYSPHFVSSVPHLPGGSVKLGPMDTGASIQLDISLVPSHEAELAQLLQDMYTPGNAQYHHYLKKGQFAEDFGAPESTVSQVDGVLTSDGMSVGSLASNGLTIPVTTTVGTAESVFGVSISEVRLADGKTAISDTTAPKVPAALRPYVAAVVGLDTASVEQPQALAHQFPVSAPSSNTATLCNLSGATAIDTEGYTTNTIFNYYNLEGSTTPNGQDIGAYLPVDQAGEVGLNQTIALFEQGAFSTADILYYQECFGVGTVLPDGQDEVSVIPVDGGNDQFSIEADLDVEDVISLVPDAQILVYEAPNSSTGQIDEYDQIVSDDLAQVVSTSWGLCEPDEDQQVITAENIAFEQAAAQGQTVLASAGDAGSEDCIPNGSPSEGTSANAQLAVDDPASQPFVTGVGGTSFNAYLEPTVETVWNDGIDGGAGGGGISTEWEMPSWQQGLGVANSYSSGTPCGASAGDLCREVPDVSALADPEHGYVVYAQGQWTAVGGTSAATPLWASIVVLQNQTCTDNGEPDTGFANPRLYAMAESNPEEAYYSSSENANGTFSALGYMNDISGANAPHNNDMTGSNGGAYPAYDPYDFETFGYYYSMAAGLGSPNGLLLFNDDNAVTMAGGASEGVMCSTNPQAVGSILDPIVTSVSPQTGSPSGGTVVTISGNNFSGVTDVHFGTAEATTYKVISTTEIEAIAPPLAIPAGQNQLVVDVTVNEGSAASAISEPYDYFIYTSGPQVDAVSSLSTTPPAGTACGDLANGSLVAAPYGPASGGNTVAVCGTGLNDVTSVSFFTAYQCVPIASGSGTPVTTAGCGGTFAACGDFVPPEATPPASCYLQSPTTSFPVTTAIGANGQEIQQLTVTAPQDPNVTGFTTCDMAFVVVATTSGSSVPNAGFNSSEDYCPPSASQPAGTAYTGNSYGYTNLPLVTSISAGGSPLQGDVPMTIQGFNFLVQTGYTGPTQCAGNPSVLGVSFGSPSILGSNCKVLSNSEIVVDAPPVAYPGTIDVEIDTATPPGIPTAYQPEPQFSISFSPPVASDHFSYVACSVSYTTQSIVGMAVAGSGTGYVIADGSGRTAACGSATYFGSPDDPDAYNVITQAPSTPTPRFYGCPYPQLEEAQYPSKQNDWIVATTMAPDSQGYWEVDNSGEIFPFETGFYGDIQQVNPNVPPGGSNSDTLTCPIVGMAATPDGGGYWLVTSNGEIYAFGDATDYGNLAGTHLNEPIVGMASTPDGEGYWLVASDGGVFTFGPTGGAWSFGDAAFYGSTGNINLNEPIVGMASTPTGAGYWLVGADGGVFTFGDAGYYGSSYSYSHCFNIDAGGFPGNWVVGIASTPDGGGYWLVTQTGTVLPFGDAPFEGNVSTGGSTPPIMPGGESTCASS